MRRYLLFLLNLDLKAGKLADDFPVVAIMKRRDFLSDGKDVTVKQVGQTTWAMPAYLLILDENNHDELGMRVEAEKIETEWNKYADDGAINNMRHVRYLGSIGGYNLGNDDRESLDHFVTTKDVVTFAQNYYGDIIKKGGFFNDVDLINTLFGRPDNNEHLDAVFARYD